MLAQGLCAAELFDAPSTNALNTILKRADLPMRHRERFIAAVTKHRRNALEMVEEGRRRLLAQQGRMRAEEALVEVMEGVVDEVVADLAEAVVGRLLRVSIGERLRRGTFKRAVVEEEEEVKEEEASEEEEEEEAREEREWFEDYNEAFGRL